MKKVTMSFIQVLSALVFICLAGQVSTAQTLGALHSLQQEMDVYLIEEGTEIIQVLEKMEQRFNVVFLYRSDTMQNRKIKQHISLSTNIESSLKLLLADTGLNFKYLNPKTYGIYADGEFTGSKNRDTYEMEDITIRGRVVDAQTGEALPGVNIFIKDTNTGTTTDVEGNYEITIPTDDTVLIFSYIGYESLEINVDGSTELNLELTPTYLMGGELVVVGYGTTQRADLSSSISTVSPENFAQGAFSSPTELLQGQVPGLHMTKDGNPYGNAAVVLRGPSTLRPGAAQEPLYVVDGVPGVSLDMVPVDDILSIDILRDASATAIYGSRAANGVIMITTSKGEQGVTRISYSGYIAQESIANKFDVLSGEEYTAWLAENGTSVKPTFNDGANINWQDEVTRNAFSHENNISISGGSSNTTYIGGLTYQTREGIMKGTGLNRVRFRANVENEALQDRLRIGVNLTTSVSESEHIPGVVFGEMLNYVPTQNIRNPDGSFKEDFSEGNMNPVALIAQNIDERKTKSLLGTAYANINLIDNLSFNFRTSYQNQTNERGLFYQRESYLARGQDGVALRSSYEDEQVIMEMHANYNFLVAENHDISLLAGYSWQEDKIGNGFQATTEGFPSNATKYYNMGLASPPSGYLPDFGHTHLLRMRQISAFSRINYQFGNKYMLQATIRRDGSSAFGEHQRWGTFPSISVGWWVSEERFMQALPVGIKLRASYGESGNALGFNPLISRMRFGDSGSYYFNGEYRTGLAPVQNPNPDLRWETTKMTNIGVDWEAFQGRLSGTIDWYNKLTEGLIWDYPVSTTQFFASVFTANVGEMENKGIEFTLNAIPVHSQDFSWNTSFNISHNRNVIKSLSDDRFTLDHVYTGNVGGAGQSGMQQQIIQEGYPIGQFYLWEWMGYNDDGISVFRTRDGGTTTNPTSDDRFYQGDAQPDLIFGFHNRFNYKNIDFSFQFRGVTGNYILNASRASMVYTAEATRFNSLREVVDTPFSDSRSHFNSTRYLERGDFLRLDNLTAGYTLSGLFGAVDNIRLYATVNNVFTITNYKGIDPEVNIGGIEPGLDARNYYPRTRSILLGFNIDF